MNCRYSKLKYGKPGDLKGPAMWSRWNTGKGKTITIRNREGEEMNCENAQQEAIAEHLEPFDGWVPEWAYPGTIVWASERWLVFAQPWHDGHAELSVSLENHDGERIHNIEFAFPFPRLGETSAAMASRYMDIMAAALTAAKAEFEGRELWAELQGRFPCE